uniref:Uncharacterized protein n=1 Tax=Rhizophora mucronata TaxID=61149 RepID=A0A2P2IQT7_RHIMU
MTYGHRFWIRRLTSIKLVKC